MIARFDDSRDDRRIEHRVRLVVEVTLESPSNLYTGVSRDLSRGGVFVATHQLVPIGTEVKLDVQLAAGPVSLNGVVRWQRDGNEDIPSGLGIAFSRLLPEQLAILGAVCDEREPYLYEFDDH